MTPNPSALNGTGDAELVAACREGRKEAFGELVERYQDRAFNLAYRLTGSSHDAAESVQEAFLKAFRALERFRGDSAFYTWLFRITVNVVRSRQRFKAVRPAEYSLDTSRGGEDPAESRWSLCRQMAARVPDPLDEASQAERKVLVEKALQRLDPGPRMIIVLRDIEGRDYAEIADLLDCPRGTVKSRLHRARMALRKILAPMLARDQEAAT